MKKFLSGRDFLSRSLFEKLFLTAIILSLALPVFSKFPITLYHAHPNMSFTEEMFAGHMNFLYEEGFSTVTLDDLLDWHQNNAIMPLRPIVIAFDDNYIDVYNMAYPVLKDLGFVGVNYTISNSVGSVTPTIEYCDWDVLTEMEENKVFYSESHAHTHPHLANLTDEEIREELTLSKTILEENLEREIIHLAYPYGSYNQTVLDLAEEAGYITAVTTISGFNYRDTPLLELRRLFTDGITLNQFRERLQWENRQPAPTGEGWIIDNQDTNFSVISGNWETSSNVAAWENSYSYSSAGDGSGEVRWAAYLREEGYYRLYVWIPASVQNTGIVSYTILHEDGSTEVNINQNQSQSGWHSLGGFFFNENTPVQALLNDGVPNNVVADALWIEPSEVTFVSDWRFF